MAHEIRMMREGGGDARGMGVEQQFRGVESVAEFRSPRTLGAKAIVCAILQARHEAEMHIAEARCEGNAGHLRLALEQADGDARGMPGGHGYIGAVREERDARREGQNRGCRLRAQVITEGSARPVRGSIPAIERDKEMRLLSAACVSTACRLASGSYRSR